MTQVYAQFGSYFGGAKGNSNEKGMYVWHIFVGDSTDQAPPATTTTYHHPPHLSTHHHAGHRCLSDKELPSLLELMFMQRLGPNKSARVYIVGAGDCREWMAIAAACSDPRWKAAGG